MAVGPFRPILAAVTAASALLLAAAVAHADPLDDQFFALLSRDGIVGPPDQVSEKLERLRQEIGLDGILAELNPGSLVPHALVMNALRLLCQEVVPRFEARRAAS